MIITGAIPAVAVIGGAVVVVGAAAATIRYLRAGGAPEQPATGVTVDVEGVERGAAWTSTGRDWSSIREEIVHGDPFESEATTTSSFDLVFANALGIDAVDVIVEFRDFSDLFEVEGQPYRFDRLEQGARAAIPIVEGAAVQGRIPVWVTYSIDGDPTGERHTIDLSVIALRT